MKLVTIAVAMIFALGAAGVSMSAQGRGNGQAKKTTQARPAGAKTQPRTAKADARAAKTTTKAETRAARTATKTETRAARAEAKTIRTETKAAKTNPQQEARLLAMLPPGTNIQDASMGFKNRGQFIAAVNASSNHSIPFADLKAKMTGIAPGATEPTMAPMSLGQAIQSFKGTTTTPLP
jgi:hypothetical protein